MGHPLEMLRVVFEDHVIPVSRYRWMMFQPGGGSREREGRARRRGESESRHRLATGVWIRVPIEVTWHLIRGPDRPMRILPLAPSQCSPTARDNLTMCFCRDPTGAFAACSLCWPPLHTATLWQRMRYPARQLPEAGLPRGPRLYHSLIIHVSHTGKAR